MIDVQAVRNDFPVLSRQVYGRPLVYLDNAATSQKPRCVLQALTEYYESYNSNVHRGVHALSMEATQRYEEARQKVAQFIGATTPQSIIFTRNTTEAINLVAYTWGRANLGPGDAILLTEMEHHSNLVPWQQLAREKGASLRFIPVTDAGSLDLSDLDTLLSGNIRLVALTQVSNVLGTINPVKQVTQMAHQAGAVVLVDAAQSVPHLPVCVEDLGCEFLAFSGHKMLAPTGIGVLYAKMDMLEHMEPFLWGGEMVQEVSLDGATWNEIPLRFEAGTPNIAGAIALGVAIDYLQSLGMENVRQHEEHLIRYALNAFKELEGDIEFFGPRDSNSRSGLISFYCSKVHPHDLGTFLDREGIAIRTGHLCAMPLMRKLGVPALARASFYIHSTDEEVSLLVHGLKRALAYFGGSVTPIRTG